MGGGVDRREASGFVAVIAVVIEPSIKQSRASRPRISSHFDMPPPCLRVQGASDCERDRAGATGQGAVAEPAGGGLGHCGSGCARRGKKAAKDCAAGRRLGAKVVELGESPLAAGLIWITVPDDAIAAVATELAAQQEWSGRTVFHSSGALTSDALQPLRAKGARVASVHPGMTFVARSVPSLKGVPFGIEGDAAALRLARRVIGRRGRNR